jgi:DNA repair ATPase RecN
MKKIALIAVLVMLSGLWVQRAQAQAQELEELALDIQKLSSLKAILQEMYDGYKILTTGYNTIVDISKGNFSLHKLFLDGLLSVSPTVKKYARIVDIINGQLTLVKEYKTAMAHFRGLQLFSNTDLNYLQSVYDNLISRSLQNLDELTTILTDNKLRASDAERLNAIDRIYQDMEDKVEFMRHFNNNTGLLATQRAQALQENQTIQRLYGIQP